MSAVEKVKAQLSAYLFPDHESADRFRSFYVKQSWAETEAVTGEFSVIRIEGTEEPQDALV